MRKKKESTGTHVAGTLITSILTILTIVPCLLGELGVDEKSSFLTQVVLTWN
jgi:hypothetical protein